MNRIYEKISAILIKNHAINENDKELYEYAIKLTVHGIINIMVIVIVGIFFGMLKQSLCLFITLFVLRKITGGLHFEKYLYCFICSLFLIIVSLQTIKFLEKSEFDFEFFCITNLSIIFIWILSPADNQNKKLSLKEKRIYKYYAIAISLSFQIIVYAFICNQNALSYSFGIGIVIISIFLILAKIRDVSIKYLKK